MFLEKKDRKVIPRWRDSRTTTALAELNSLGCARKLEGAEIFFRDKTYQWKQSQTIFHASDLISAAAVLGRNEDAQEAAKFLADHSSECRQATLRLAMRILHPESHLTLLPPLYDVNTEDAQKQIHSLRKRLHDEPRNSIIWTDVARQYTTIGQNDHAARAMRIACALAPTNRFVLRSASRFFLHYGDARHAYRLLRNAETTHRDPWLLAAEMTLASESAAPQPHVKIARRIVEDANFSPFSTTELASALGTLELEAGRDRKAKQLFRRSLTLPTENSVAQAEWAASQLAGLEVDVNQFQVPRIFEAKAWDSVNRCDWDLALTSAIDWLRDQPFSTRPAVFASYIASTVLEKYDESVRIIRSSLISNPADPLLKNNLAFALASSGRVDEAEAELASVDSENPADLPDVTLMATKGLVCFRKGQTEQGRTLYLRAIELARRRFMYKHAALATVYLAREEVIANTPLKTQALQRAVSESKSHSYNDVLAVLSRIRATQRIEPEKASGHNNAYDS